MRRRKVKLPERSRERVYHYTTDGKTVETVRHLKLAKSLKMDGTKVVGGWIEH